MKTPEEIKKRLSCFTKQANGTCELVCGICEAYSPGYSLTAACTDAIAYIQQHEAELKSYKAEAGVAQRALESARQELETVKRERDAAVSDLECGNECYSCKYRDNRANCDQDESCYNCRLDCPCATFKCNWEWRGVCQENTEVQEDG